jgi:hypothetical protein
VLERHHDLTRTDNTDHVLRFVSALRVLSEQSCDQYTRMARTDCEKQACQRVKAD